MMSSSSAVSVRDLRVDRGGHRVLHDLAFEVPRGVVVGLLGPSGCGKTTLLRAVTGVQVIRGGEVIVLGTPAGSPELRRKVGYATQNPAVYLDLTVGENLRYFGSVLGAPKRDPRRVADEVGLSEQLGQIAGTLSGGQLARVSLAVALLGAPELLVLDEPTVGLDPLLRQELWELFHRLAAGGVTLLVSSHVMDEAARCDRLLLLREGRLLADDAPDALRAEAGVPDLEQVFLRLIAERAGSVEETS